MTERERIRIRENYKKAKLIYDEWVKCYPFGLEDLDGEEWKEAKNGGGFYHIKKFQKQDSAYSQTDNQYEWLFGCPHEREWQKNNSAESCSRRRSVYL